MKRKLNESVAGSIKIDVVSLVNDYPELQGNVDKLAKQIEDTIGASVSQEESDDTIYMVIDGVTPDDIIDMFSEDYYIDDIDSYFAYDADLEDIENDEDAKAAAVADMKDTYGDKYVEMDENVCFDDEGDWTEDCDDIDDEETYDETYDEEYDDTLDDMIPDYDDVDIDDEDDIYSDEYESIDDEYTDDDELNDASFDECMEDEEFECYESKHRDFRSRRFLNEKKKGCCPPKKNRMVNLSESLKMLKNGVSVKDIVNSAKRVSLNESIIADAINKAKNEKEKKNINEKRTTLESLKKALGEDKFNTIVKALKEGKKTLYTKKNINGKNITEYSSKELLNILNLVKEQRETLIKSYKSLNESATKTTKKELRDAIELKERLMNLLDEELTYRLTVKKMLKEQDEENPLEPLSVDPSESGEKEEKADDATETSGEKDVDTEDPEEDEEVELSRVVITVANQEAADELKDAMVNAGIPEDAIEFETESETEEEESKEDDSEEEKDEKSEEDTKEDAKEESNESIHYNKFKKLLEDEETDEETPAEDDTEKSDDEASEEETEKDKDADGEVKVVLTNTDYINDLADVLNNEYGITKEEFEEMIGGTIVDDETEENSEESEKSDENKEEDSKDEPSTNGDDAVDSMSQEELDKLFGGN